MKLKPIGKIHSPFKVTQETPIQPFKSKTIGRVEVYKEFACGLQDITGFSHIMLIYQFHKSKGYKLLVTPFLDRQTRGLFATRYPRRPNQIGISVVRLLKRKDNILFVKGIDVLDGTPLLDIKPYVPDFAVTTKVKIGWLKNKDLRGRKKL
jgi:tRNA-Thr(GGU) m(6)t(6)A37 methyltransferase TsaA